MPKVCYARGCYNSNKNCDLKFFMFPRNPQRAQLWAERLGMPCDTEHARTLSRQHICSLHFSETDFIVGDRTSLERLAVPNPLTVASHSNSAQHHGGPSSNSSSCEEYLPVLTPTKKYSTKSKTSVTKEPIQIHPDTSLPSHISPDMSVPAETSTFSNDDTSFSLVCASESASGEELRSVNLQSSSPKRKARHSLIKDLGLDRVAELTPRKKKLYDRIWTRESALCKLRKKYVTKNMKEVCQLDSNPLIQALSHSLSVPTSTFLASFFRNIRHKPEGRRWSLKEKVLALSLLKRSPKSYTFLHSLFPLPSRRSLQSILNTVRFRTGINAHVFNTLKRTVQTMSDGDNVCCLMFDEMSIRENLHFNQKFGCIDGFEDLGSHGRTSSIANHALVFMLRGLRKRWKQPVAYYLIHGSTKGDMLVNFLEEVLDASFSAGLEVVATVCDMGANNVKALKHFGVSEETPFFRFRDQEIAAIFDPPQLLKCTRNLFLKHDVANVESDITVNGERLTGTAKWDDILKLYEVEKRSVCRLLPHITERHTKPSGPDMMKVRLAAQVMSRTVAAAISTLVAVGYMDSRCLSTTAFVNEIDSLFDSFNGVSHNPNPGKVLRCRLSSTSKHLEHWQNAARKIKSWTFLNKGCGQIRPPPSQTGWLITIAAVQHVWRRVKEKKLKYLETRNLNQDALENIFGAIRLHCGSNNNPSVGQFVDALKTVIINGLAYRGLLDPNCEEDGASLLDNLHSFLKPSTVSSPSQSTSHDRETTDDVPYIAHATEAQERVHTAIHAGEVKIFSVAYVSGFIARHLLHNGSCDACKACPISKAPSPTNVYISFKECSSTVHSLTYPTEQLVETVGTAVTVLEDMMLEVAHLDTVESCITGAIKKSVNFEWIRLTGCPLHHQRIEDEIVRSVTRISIPWWCKRKNQSLREETRQKALKRKVQILSHL